MVFTLYMPPVRLPKEGWEEVLATPKYLGTKLLAKTVQVTTWTALYQTIDSRSGREGKGLTILPGRVIETDR